jgi:excisionase family DNA binding protein
MMRLRNVGCPKTVPDVHCRGKQIANVSAREENYMPIPNAEPVLEEHPELESGPFRATLMAVEVAKHLKVHLSTVYKMTKHGELPGFKIGNEWRFDRAQIEEWIRSRREKPEG